MASPQQYAEDRAKLLGDRLRGIQARLDKLTAEVGSTAETSAAYWKSVQTKARALYEEMRRITRGVITTSVGTSYDASIRDAISRLKASEFTPRTVTYKEFSRSQVYSQGLDAILSETLGAFANGYLSGETQFLRLMRLTQQVNLTEKQVNKAVEEGYLETGSPQGTARRLRDELLAKMQDGKYISLIDKNGNTRQYTVDAYAELVTRTKLIEATTAGVTQATLAAGGDLVQVSVHNTECEVCAPYEGHIYSLSGSDPDFPPVEELPPYHPQCVLGGTRCESAGDFISGLRAWYDGDVVELTFSKSGRIAVTVNHMFLTPRGFVKADTFKKCDNVFYCPSKIRVTKRNPYINWDVPTIDEEFVSLQKTFGMTTTRVPASPEDVHGDGAFFDGQIDIIRPNCFLRGTSKALFLKNNFERGFNKGLGGAFDFFRQRYFATMLKRLAFAADGLVGCPRKTFPLLKRSPFIKKGALLFSGSKRNPTFQKSTPHNHPVSPNAFSKICKGLSGIISLDQVIDIKRYSFHGFVYNLQTSTSIYMSNGLLSSNCAHSIDPVFKEFLDVQGTLDDFIAFSNDETDTHPTRTSWVPVGKRSLH